VRAILVQAGASPGASVHIDSDNWNVHRAYVEDWLREKESIAACWIKAGAIAAIAAAVFALLAWLLPIK
jgi:hypothetical protein